MRHTGKRLGLLETEDRHGVGCPSLGFLTFDLAHDLTSNDLKSLHRSDGLVACLHVLDLDLAHHLVPATHTPCSRQPFISVLKSFWILAVCESERVRKREREKRVIMRKTHTRAHITKRTQVQKRAACLRGGSAHKGSEQTSDTYLTVPCRHFNPSPAFLTLFCLCVCLSDCRSLFHTQSHSRDPKKCSRAAE
jgi:hypothetical protein